MIQQLDLKQMIRLTASGQPTKTMVEWNAAEKESLIIAQASVDHFRQVSLDPVEALELRDYLNQIFPD